jgi:GTPase SAR1 family protein
LLVFAIDDAASFSKVGTWLEDIRNLAMTNAQIMLIGNKLDLDDKRQVSNQEAEDYAKQNGLIYCEMSAKTAAFVSDSFLHLATGIMEAAQAGKLQLQYKELTLPPPPPSDDCAC